ncbi:MAG: DNA methyltransferase [Candidatus Pacearchaeota archaeon]
MEINKVYLMDAKELLKNFPDNKRIVIITDPPYGINLDLKWLSDMNIARGEKPNKADHNIEEDNKPFNAEHLLIYKRRLIFGFPYIYDANATGWIIWDKQPKVNERSIVTPVEVASTTLRKGYDIFRVMWGGFMRDLDFNEKRYEHPTQKPIKLMKRLIEKFTKEGDLIIDPYCGSGSTLVACKKLGRDFIGCDIKQEYVDLANRRLEETKLDKSRQDKLL